MISIIVDSTLISGSPKPVDMDMVMVMVMVGLARVTLICPLWTGEKREAKRGRRANYQISGSAKPRRCWIDAGWPLFRLWPPRNANPIHRKEGGSTTIDLQPRQAPQENHKEAGAVSLSAMFGVPELALYQHRFGHRLASEEEGLDVRIRCILLESILIGRLSWLNA